MEIFKVDDWSILLHGKSKIQEGDIIYQMRIGGGLGTEDIYYDINLFISQENYEKLLDGTYKMARFPSNDLQPIIIFDKDNNIIPLIKGKEDEYEENQKRYIKTHKLNMKR